MGEFLRTVWVVTRAHALRSFWRPRALVSVALALLPALVASVIAQLTHRNPAVEIASNTGGMIVLQIVVPILALIAGSAVVSEEVEDRTITFLFSRPIARPALLFGRWFSALFFLAAVLLPSIWLMLQGAARSRAPGPVLDFAFAVPLYQAALIGAVVYSALFATAGVFFRHSILVGLGYAFAVEGFLANLPGQNQSLTIQYWLRSFVLDRGTEAWRQVEGFGLTKYDTSRAAVTTLACVLVISLVLGAWRLARREFLLSA
jgi:ABC-type transport system involved in multi-copper enzyme maturation permease subunit